MEETGYHWQQDGITAGVFQEFKENANIFFVFLIKNIVFLVLKKKAII